MAHSVFSKNQYAVPDRFRPTLESHLESCVDELTRHIIRLIMLAFLHVQPHLMSPTGSDWTSLLLCRDWIFQKCDRYPELIQLANEIDTLSKESDPDKNTSISDTQKVPETFENVPTSPESTLITQSHTVDVHAYESCPMCARPISMNNSIKAICSENHSWGMHA